MSIIKIFFILIYLISLIITFPVNASRTSDSYDGNIFPIYAGNGSIVPPQTTLKESIENNRTSILFFYLDDSSNSKSMVPIISGLDLIWRNKIDIIALTTDELQGGLSSSNKQDASFYWNGYIPQTIVIDGSGEVVFDKNGLIDIDEINKIIAKAIGVEIDDSTFSLESFNEYNSRISKKVNPQNNN